MELSIELSKLSDRDRTELARTFPASEVYHSTGVIGGDPLLTVLIPVMVPVVPGTILALSKLVEKWQQLGIQRRVQIKIDDKAVQLDFKGLSASQITKILDEKLADLHAVNNRK